MTDSMPQLPVADLMHPIGLEALRRLPKAELHCHLDGSVRPETLLEIGKKRGVSMPRDDARSLREFMIVNDARSLEEYLTRFEVTLAAMQRADALERIAYELAEDAHRDGVFYIEVRFCPMLNVQGGLAEHEAVEAVLRGLARAEGDHGILARVIVTAMRGMPPEKSLEMARLAVAYRHNGVAGFDLAGGEFGNPASAHAGAFEYARSHDLACTCHAGGTDQAREGS